MKKTTTTIILLLLFLNIMQAQNKIFETQKDPKGKSNNILVGQISVDDIIKDGTCTWMQQGLKEYKPDSTIIKELKKVINNYEFIVCIGTWCGDTQDLFPQFWKTMQATGYPLDKIELLGMDRDKHALQIEHLLLKVEYLPTIIIRKGPLEIYRIVESLEKKTIEQELLFYIQKSIKEGQ